MSISSTGLYGSASIVNSDVFNDVESLKEQVTTLSTSYLDTTREHRIDISQNRLDISQNRLDISQNRLDISQNRFDISQNRLDISQNTLDISQNRLDISQNKSDISQNRQDISQNRQDISVRGSKGFSSLMNKFLKNGSLITTRTQGRYSRLSPLAALDPLFLG
jgi:exonuclease VII large subunit